jgi:hypothetical protein
MTFNEVIHMERNNKQATKIVAASLLGDGNIHRENGTKNGRFSLTQIPKHADHVEYVAQFLEPITRLRRYEQPPVDKVIMGKQSRSNGRYSIISMNHPFYTAIYNRWYGTGRKAIDPHYLTLLDFEMLAIWYQQDGSLGVRGSNIHRIPLFMTDNFTYAEVQLLSRAVYERLNIITTLRKERKQNGEYYYRLRVSAKSTELFVDKIRPYVQPSFQYKLDI